ncbi:TetR/AcrR family transcriptional regulator [Altericroceibacterium spongiae]|uniref:TetR/AcrR family transcriptional regulator n=1 Tax=Altericroceibacterium spongiae TaxID=2320269 RepID=A0A420EAD7_9SPHN|nr:TetR/AcrR family transcriptional regulator [Altericroceibacterium spongiae]RKF17631.1 TetR/AcrR family transcriptional regulator [Altericroceibacterium spongiae]
MASVAKRPTQARAAKTRARILKVALKIFVECGFEGANIRQIAAAADSTHSMITDHFGGKEELWKQAVAQMFATAREELKPLPGDMDLPPREAFRRHVRRYIRYCARHPEHRLVVHRLSDHY